MTNVARLEKPVRQKKSVTDLAAGGQTGAGAYGLYRLGKKQASLRQLGRLIVRLK